MGYTIYWNALRRHSSEDLKRYNKIWMSVYNREIQQIRNKGLSTETVEWAGSEPMGNEDYEYMKTERNPYDYAVKKAMIEVQKASKNGWKITCDDGIEYVSSGLVFEGYRLIDSYKPIKRMEFQLSDLPTLYMSKGMGELKLGEYEWNEGKNPKPLKLYQGKRGGIFHIRNGEKVYTRRKVI